MNDKKVFYVELCITAEDFGKRYISCGTLDRCIGDRYIVIPICGDARVVNKIYQTREEAEAALKNGG